MTTYLKPDAIRALDYLARRGARGARAPHVARAIGLPRAMLLLSELVDLGLVSCCATVYAITDAGDIARTLGTI